MSSELVTRSVRLCLTRSRSQLEYVRYSLTYVVRSWQSRVRD